MPKELVFVDFETFWSKTHTLKKLSPISYVMHPDTELISLALKVGVGGETIVVFGEDEIRRLLRDVDLSDKVVVGHNMSAFDSLILAWRLGQRPAFWACTMAMARPIHAKTTGLSLAALVKHYADELSAMGISPVKDNTALVNTQGKHLADFMPDEIEAMRAYNRDDTDQCAGLFTLLRPHFTGAELFHIDCNIRMLVEPGFRVNTQLLHEALRDERAAKHQALMDVARHLRPTPETVAVDVVDGPEYEDDEFWLQDEDQIAEYVRKQLASAPKLSALLEARGVEVPMKPSPTGNGTMIPALAKTDSAFVELLEHEDPLVAAATRARLAVRSTILETRIDAFLETAQATGGALPVPLHYCGADTTGRDSGWLYNPQNLPRIPRDRDGNIVPKPANALRLCIEAPDGHLVGVADQSGIELRVNHFLWKVASSMALYQASPDKADLYRAFASESLYLVPPDQISKDQRQIGKVAQLGLGFGAGAPTFQRVAKNMGGVNLPLSTEDAPPDDPEAMTCEKVVLAWREKYSPIVEGWRSCQSALNDIVRGLERSVDPWGLVHTSKHGLHLPSGRLIRYPNLRYTNVGQTWPDGTPKKSWAYAEGRHRAFLTGPKVDENIVQALARDSVFEAALRFFRETGLRPRMRLHDELIYLFPAAEAEALLARLQKLLRTPPSWWPALVVWSEGDVAPSYGLAK